MTRTSAQRPVALVTGANKGIGRETVAQLATHGMTVLLAARDQERGATAAGELRAAGADVHPLVLDVTDRDSVTAAADWVEQRYGRLDVLVNNAAIAVPPAALGGSLARRDTASAGQDDQVPTVPSRTDPDAVRAVFETNVFGVIAVTNALLPLLLRSAAPRIVNVSSGVASLTLIAEHPTLPPSLAYPVSKTALNAVTVQYAREFRGTPLLVNAVDPGFTATDMNQHRGHRTVAQAAAVVVQLATLGPDGPTGWFVDEEGPQPW